MTAEEERTPEIHEQLRAKLFSFLGTGRAPWADRMLEREYVRPDGRRLFVQGVVSSVTTDEGFMLVGTCRDVTEAKRAEEALRKAHDDLEMRVQERTAELEQANRALQTEIAEHQRATGALRKSEERLRLALEATSEGLWENNFGREQDYFSDRMYTMLGYEPMDPAKGFQFFDNLLHPDDRERAEHVWQRLDRRAIAF
jgi:PAS domain-containing protein